MLKAVNFNFTPWAMTAAPFPTYLRLKIMFVSLTTILAHIHTDVFTPDSSLMNTRKTSVFQLQAWHVKNLFLLFNPQCPLEEKGKRNEQVEGKGKWKKKKRLWRVGKELCTLTGEKKYKFKQRLSTLTTLIFLFFFFSWPFSWYETPLPSPMFRAVSRRV